MHCTTRQILSVQNQSKKNTFFRMHNQLSRVLIFSEIIGLKSSTINCKCSAEPIFQSFFKARVFSLYRYRLNKFFFISEYSACDNAVKRCILFLCRTDDFSQATSKPFQYLSFKITYAQVLHSEWIITKIAVIYTPIDGVLKNMKYSPKFLVGT